LWRIALNDFKFWSCGDLLAEEAVLDAVIRALVDKLKGESSVFFER